MRHKYCTALIILNFLKDVYNEKPRKKLIFVLIHDFFSFQVLQVNC